MDQSSKLSLVAIWLRCAAVESGQEGAIRKLIQDAMQITIEMYGLPGDGQQGCPIMGHDAPRAISEFAFLWDENARMSKEDAEFKIPEAYEGQPVEDTAFSRIVRSSYSLRLTQEERKAIDTVGKSHAHGRGLHDLLWLQTVKLPDDAGWDDERELVFGMEEDTARQIADIADKCDHRWDGFDLELEEKMEEFVNRIT